MPTANANGIQIEYDTFGDPTSPALLMIIGVGCQLIHWQDEFCKQIADSGYYVIRYDNRDSGLSTKFDKISGSVLMEKTRALLGGQKVRTPYTIKDMANDALGLLDSLNIKKAHICGMSMGGYIAQTFVINNPSRTLSLTSIYSHTGNRQAFPPTQEATEASMKPSPNEREPYIEHMLHLYKLLYGTGLPFDEDFHRKLAGRLYDRSYCPEGKGRQYLAIMVQNDRTAELSEIKLPSLIIHGDEDPLVPFAGGKATAKAIPGAEFMVVAGMGHVMPNLDAYWDKIMDAMIKHMEKVQ